MTTTVGDSGPEREHHESVKDVDAAHPEPLPNALRQILFWHSSGRINTDQAIDRIREAVAQPEIGPAEYDPTPLRRSELVQQLDARRDNFVYVLVPVAGRQPVQLGIAAVEYVPTHDHIVVRTAPWYLGVEPEGPIYTARLSLPADDLEVPESGPRWQVTDGKDETTWHDLTAVTDCADPSCSITQDGFDCLVLVSTAWADGFAHWNADELISVRIPAGEQ